MLMRSGRSGADGKSRINRWKYSHTFFRTETWIRAHRLLIISSLLKYTKARLNLVFLLHFKVLSVSRFAEIIRTKKSKLKNTFSASHYNSLLTTKSKMFLQTNKVSSFTTSKSSEYLFFW